MYGAAAVGAATGINRDLRVFAGPDRQVKLGEVEQDVGFEAAVPNDCGFVRTHIALSSLFSLVKLLATQEPYFMPLRSTAQQQLDDC